MPPLPMGIGIYTSFGRDSNAISAISLRSSTECSDNNCSVFSNIDRPAKIAGALSLVPLFCCLPDRRVRKTLTLEFFSSFSRCIRQVNTHAILAIKSRLNIACGVVCSHDSMSWPACFNNLKQFSIFQRQFQVEAISLSANANEASGFILSFTRRPQRLTNR